MAWKKGQSGNPGGRGNEKAFADAIRAAVNVEDPKTRRRKLLAIADVVADAAMAGEPWAVSVVADRLDGKPAQESNVTIEKRDSFDWTRTELAAFLAQSIAANGSEGVAAEDGCGGEPDSVH